MIKRATVSFWTATAMLASAGCAQTIRPQGLFFHSFTGTVSGTEWATWGPLGVQGRYEFADVRSSGAYAATFASDNSFLLDGGVGSGRFFDANRARVDFDFGGGTFFHSNIVRAPHTDDRFPVFFTGAVSGDASVAGRWSVRVREVNPATGVPGADVSTAVDVSVAGATIRVDMPDGTFYQGVWMSESQAGFRVIDRVAPDPRYRTFPGSATNVNLNMLGDLRVTGADSMTLALFFETRSSLGSFVQTMKYLEFSRVPSPGAAALMFPAGLATLHRRRRS